MAAVPTGSERRCHAWELSSVPIAKPGKGRNTLGVWAEFADCVKTNGSTVRIDGRYLGFLLSSSIKVCPS